MNNQQPGALPEQLERRLENIARLAPVAIALTDQQGRFTYVNQRLERFTGRTAQEALGTGWQAMIHPEDRDRVLSIWKDCLSRRAEFRQEFRFQRPDGSLCWVIAEAAHEMDEQNRPVGCIMTFTDVSPQRALEEERRRLQEEAAEARRLESLAALAGQIAHDFNNMLVGILGGASLALMDLPEDSPLCESLRLIEQTALQASQLTAQLLAFSGQSHITMQSVQLNGLIQNIADQLEEAAGPNARVHYFLAQPLPNVTVDPAHLRQVMLNLIVNAAEVCGEPGGEITISTGCARAEALSWDGAPVTPTRAPECGCYVMIEVRDNGPGLDDLTRTIMFEPIFSTKSSGRSLGLAAVAGMVRAHKGGIQVSSELGRGTTIRIFLPAETCPEDLCHGHSVPTLPWVAQPCILVVDDEETVRSVVRQIFERQGYTVLTAHDGREGVEVFQAHQNELHAVLLDLTMPVCGGDKAFEQMRAINPEIPVILFSGYSEQDALSRFHDKGLAGFIQKPFRPQDLLAKFQSVVGSRSH